LIIAQVNAISKHNTYWYENIKYDEVSKLTRLGRV